MKPILTPEDERQILGEDEPKKPILTSAEERELIHGSPGPGDFDEFLAARDQGYAADMRQRTADEGFDRYLGRQDDEGDFDKFLSEHGGESDLSPGDMDPDELRRLLGGDADVMSDSSTASAPSAEQRERNANYSGGAGQQRAAPAADPQDRWMAAYAATMERMGVPEQYWRTERAGQPRVGNPYQSAPMAPPQGPPMQGPLRPVQPPAPQPLGPYRGGPAQPRPVGPYSAGQPPTPQPLGSYGPGRR